VSNNAAAQLKGTGVAATSCGYMLAQRPRKASAIDRESSGYLSERSGSDAEMAVNDVWRPDRRRPQLEPIFETALPHRWTQRTE
jgi:hypothetical protein